MKLDATNGHTIWISKYADSLVGTMPNSGTDIIADMTGNIYVTGVATNTFLTGDFVTIKYDSTGTMLWSNVYEDTTYHLNCIPSKLLLLDWGVIVIGALQINSTNYDIGAVSYDNTGTQIGNVTAGLSSSIGADIVNDATRDKFGNIYITGAINVSGQGYDYYLVKLDYLFLQIQWEQTYNGTDNLDDVARAIAVDNNTGKVYITGYTTSATQGKNYATIGFDSTGTLVFFKTFNDSLNGDDVATGIIVDPTSGNIIVTGSAHTATNNDDFYTEKYVVSTGAVRWGIYSDGTAHLNELPYNIKLDNNGNVIVSGTSQTSSSSFEYKTVQYIQTKGIPNYSTFSQVTDFYGQPNHLNDILIVRFNPAVLNMNIINKRGVNCSVASTFINDSMITELGHTIFSGTEETRTSLMANTTTRKIFSNMTQADSISISRSGEHIQVPPFWATLMFYFQGKVDIITICKNLTHLFPGVIYSHPDFIMHFDTPIVNDSLFGEQASLAPTDTFPNGNINIDTAWTIQTGKPYVRIGVYDTGIDTLNPDLSVYKRVDFSNNSYDASSTIYGKHGTEVAGIIGAKRNNTTGIAGIAGGTGVIGDSTCKMFDLDVGDDVSGVYIDWAAEGMIIGASNIYTNLIYADVSRYSYKGLGLNLMNTSWGGRVTNDCTGCDSASSLPLPFGQCELCWEAAEYAFRNGCSLIASRGNWFYTYPNPIYDVQFPATIKDEMVISVGACGYNGMYKEFHNGEGGYVNDTDNYYSMIGHNVDLIAPGTRATVRTTKSPRLGGNTKYTKFNGTSASAPHVSGVVALMMSEVNTACPSDRNLSPEDVEYILQKTANPLPIRSDTTASRDSVGYGLLDAGAALKAVELPKYQIIHVNNTPTSKTITQTDTSALVALKSPYENPNIVTNPGPYATVFGNAVNDTLYWVDIFKVTETFDHTANLAHLTSSATIKGAWVLDSKSIGWNHHRSTLYPYPPHWVYDTLDVTTNVAFDAGTFTNTSVSISAYAYHFRRKYSDSSIVDKWFPKDTAHLKFEYSIYAYDPLATSSQPYSCDTTLSVHENKPIPKPDLQITNVYPSPTNQSITIEYSLEDKDAAMINIVNLVGQKIYSMPINYQHKGTYKTIIDVSNYNDGIYFVTLNTRTRVSQKKFIKLK